MESFGKPVEKCPVTVTKIFVICFETVLLLIRLAFLFGAKVVTRIYDRVISSSLFFLYRRAKSIETSLNVEEDE